MYYIERCTFLLNGTEKKNLQERELVIVKMYNKTFLLFNLLFNFYYLTFYYLTYLIILHLIYLLAGKWDSETLADFSKKGLTSQFYELNICICFSFKTAFFLSVQYPGRAVSKARLEWCSFSPLQWHKLLLFSWSCKCSFLYHHIGCLMLTLMKKSLWRINDKKCLY